MPQNQEEIEAKLAAYIDGELDAAGRAEIEKHLEINPQHRVLIRDLMQQRELVRSLPRANAPAEISETLQGQLERSVLLGSGVDAGDDVSMRMSPWPHRGAIAAVVLLTAGLGFLVYKVLPSNKPTAGELAIAPNPSQMQSSTPATLSTEQPPTATPEQPIASAGKDQVFADKIASPPGQVAPAAAASQNQVASAGSQTAGPQVPVPQAAIAPAVGTAANGQATNQTAVALGPEAVGGGVSNNSNAVEPSAEKLASEAPATPQRSLQQTLPQASQQPEWCVVVTTDNPSATDAQVRAFLIANQIHFESLSADSQLADRFGAAARFRDEDARRLSLEAGNTQRAGATTQPATQPVIQYGANGLPLAAPSTQPVNELAANKAPTTVPTISAGSVALAVQGAPSTAPASVDAALPTTQPSAVKPDAVASNAPANTAAPTPAASGTLAPTTSPTLGIASPATQPTTQAALAFAASPTSQPSGDGETPEYFCPSITTTQANDLKTMLSLRAGQSAQLVAGKRVVVAVDERDISILGGAPTTQQSQQAVDANVAPQQDQQSGAAQTQSQPIIATQLPTAAPTTSTVNEPADASKIDLVILMRRGQVTDTPSLNPSTQPAVAPNSASPTQPSNSEVPLKLP